MLTQRPSVQKQYVRSLFDSIAYRYDLLNHLLSGGVDLYWRRRAIEQIRDIKPGRILDVATGTADFAIASLRLHPREVIGIDIAEEMLRHGAKKITGRGLDGLISLRPGDAENIDFPDESFDAAIVAFGVRNFEDLERGLASMHRVLKPLGKILVLEFSQPRSFPLKQIYFFYFRNILPMIGRLVSRHTEAYTYLPDTVMKFPQDEAFLAILEKVGFWDSRQERLTGGIASVYTAIKR
jgi:demethylmenaquinone methyltransferase/2-methoxy-6-polyprenyl-1,4-benzoquinol methylase